MGPWSLEQGFLSWRPGLRQSQLCSHGGEAAKSSYKSVKAPWGQRVQGEEWVGLDAGSRQPRVLPSHESSVGSRSQKSYWTHGSRVLLTGLRWLC